MGKRQFYRECLKFAFTGGWGIADVVSFGISAIGGLVVWIFKPAEGILNILIWAVPLTVFLIIFVSRLVLAPYFLYRGKEGDLIKLENVLNDITNSKPNLIFNNCENTTQHIPLGQAKSGNRTFASIYFANKPVYQNESSIAKRVVGNIEFWDEENKKRCFSMIGRWSDAKEPHKSDFTADDIPIDIEPNGLPRKLNIVFKYLDSDDCYGYNNENYRFENLCDSRKLLTTGKYIVKIVLKGNNCTSNEFWFLLDNPRSPNEPILSFIKTI